MRRRARSPNGPASAPARRTASSLAKSQQRVTRVNNRPPSIPTEWLAGLLEIACALPVEKGPDHVAAALVERVSALIPSCAIGISVGAHSPQKRARFVGAAQGGAKVSLHPLKGRAFPEREHEVSLPVRHDHESAFLHVASDDGASLGEGTPIHLFMARVAEVLASALHTTRLVSAKGRESLELREQIIRSAKLASLGQMAAGVVHELNNPLTSIVGYSDYLRAKAEREKADPHDIERLRRIGESAGRILRFSRDLMAYAKPSIEPPSPVPIHSIIDQALVFCEHVLGRAAIRVERKYAHDLSPVLGVRDQLTQVFVNLFTNACHAMEPNGGTLTVETGVDRARRTVRSVVGDTGHGIDKENLGRVFEPFFTTKTDGRGTGLGLSIVRNIVALHGGAVSVDSKPGGTTFVVELPIAP
jgi:signal transduction histidine kinase